MRFGSKERTAIFNTPLFEVDFQEDEGKKENKPQVETAAERTFEDEVAQAGDDMLEADNALGGNNLKFEDDEEGEFRHLPRGTRINFGYVPAFDKEDEIDNDDGDDNGETEFRDEMQDLYDVAPQFPMFNNILLDDDGKKTSFDQLDPGNFFPEVREARKKPKLTKKDILVHSIWAKILYLAIFTLAVVVAVPALLNTHFFNIEVKYGVVGTCYLKPGVRTDCFPERGLYMNITETECLDRGCCINKDLNDPLYRDTPRCYQRVTSVHSVNISFDSDNDSFDLEPSYAEGEPETRFVQSKWLTSKYNDTILEQRQVALGHAALIFKSKSESVVDLGSNSNLTDLVVNYRRGDIMTSEDRSGEIDLRMRLNVTRNDPSRSGLFDSSFASVIFGRQYSEISFFLPKNYIYGLANHDVTFTGDADSAAKTLFNLDPSIGSGSQHSHPIFMSIDESRNFYGVYVETEKPAEILLLPGLDDNPLVVFRSMGGYMIIHVFTGPRPSMILDQLTQYVGRPAIPPRWALGYHTCRRTLRAERTFLDHVQLMSEGAIPFDSDCVDDNFLSSAFTLNKTQFDVNDDIDALQSIGVHPVLNQPAQVEIYSDLFNSSQADYLYFDGKLFEGSFNQKTVVIPDFTSSKTENFWLNGINMLQNQLQRRIKGFTLSYNSPLVLTQKCDNSTLDFVPEQIRIPFDLFTPCHDAQHSNSDHLKQHNHYPVQEAKATSTVDFSFSKHSHPGINPFSGIINTQIEPTWEGMRRSLRDVLSLSVSGISTVSMTACGIISQSTLAGNNVAVDSTDYDTLCLRWYQMAAMMPAMNSYHGNEDNIRTPYALAGSYRNWISQAIEAKYRLLPHYQTLTYDAFQFGYPIVRPVFYEFPEDIETWRIDEQFMVGSSIMVSPALHEESSIVNAYIPQGTWFDLWSGQKFESSGEWQVLEDIPYQIPTHLKSGTIIPILERASSSIDASYATSNYSLIVGLGSDTGPRLTESRASGEMVLPQWGNSSDPRVQFKTKASGNGDRGNLTVSSERSWTGCSDPAVITVFSSVDIYGVLEQPSFVSVNGIDLLPVTLDIGQVYYETAKERLQITSITLDICAQGSLTVDWF